MDFSQVRSLNLKKRVNIIDEVRGLCIILVVVYHLFYSLAMIFRFESCIEPFNIMRTFQPILPAMFIFISGISFHLSRNNLRRGFILLGVAALITIALWIFMPSQIIWFGIIHFLAVANLLCALLKKPLKKLPAIPGVIICVLLFLLTYNIPRGYIGFEGLWSLELPSSLYSTDLTAFLGFHSYAFRSSDYCPVLPWIFMFLTGVFVGRYVQKLPEALCRVHIRPLAFIGRHTLIIYLVHQPLIVGAISLYQMIR